MITRIQQHLDESFRRCLFLQPGVLAFGFAVDGNVGIGVLPDSQKLFIPPARRSVVHLLIEGLGSKTSHAKELFAESGKERRLRLRGTIPGILTFTEARMPDRWCSYACSCSR